MSDLVKRLRDTDVEGMTEYGTNCAIRTIEEAADRIEALEAENNGLFIRLQNYRLSDKWTVSEVDGMVDRIEELEQQKQRDDAYIVGLDERISIQNDKIKELEGLLAEYKDAERRAVKAEGAAFAENKRLREADRQNAMAYLEQDATIKRMSEAVRAGLVWSESIEQGIFGEVRPDAARRAFHAAAGGLVECSDLVNLGYLSSKALEGEA